MLSRAFRMGGAPRPRLFSTKRASGRRIEINARDQNEFIAGTE